MVSDHGITSGPVAWLVAPGYGINQECGVPGVADGTPGWQPRLPVSGAPSAPVPPSTGSLLPIIGASRHFRLVDAKIHQVCLVQRLTRCVWCKDAPGVLGAKIHQVCLVQLEWDSQEAWRCFDTAHHLTAPRSAWAAEWIKLEIRLLLILDTLCREIILVGLLYCHIPKNCIFSETKG